jgi:hypothetical protein
MTAAVCSVGIFLLATLADSDIGHVHSLHYCVVAIVLGVCGVLNYTFG